MKIVKNTVKLFKTMSNKAYTYLSLILMLLLLTACGTTTEETDTSSINEVKISETSEIDTTKETSTTQSSIISNPEDNTEGETSELQVHFIDVGQGDSTLIICDSEAMLIDAGDNNQGTKIQNYLKKQNVESLKYVVCTHPDADHIGGMDVILYKFDCETIFMTDETKDTNTYRDVIDTMRNKGYSKTLPVVGDIYTLGGAQITVLAPINPGEDSNNNSISILITHGNNKFLFSGDAEEEEESDIVNNYISIDADVYKVGHHGSKTASSEEFLNAISPTYAVISCGEGNSYGHPHSATLNILRSMGVKVFRTDEQGSIIASSDGVNITWNCSPSDTWQAGEGTQNAENHTTVVATTRPAEEQTTTSAIIITNTENQGTTTYICNTNTMKFHYLGCASVNKMSEKNKLTVTTTRQELIDQGYVPCLKCNP